MATYNQSVADALAFTEAATPTRTLRLRVRQDLAFVESVHVPRVIVVAVSDTLTFTENEVAGNHAQHPTETLTFTERVQRPHRRWVYENLPMVQSIAAGKGHALIESLRFRESASLSRGHRPRDLLAFRETVATRTTRSRSLTDTLAFSDGVAVANSNPRVVLGGVPANPAYSHTVTLTTPLGTMTLPAPDFDNAEEVGEHRINRKSTGGSLIVFHADFWPTTDEFTVKFSYLDAAQVARLRALLRGGLGLLCTFVDHEGKSRQGIVTTPALAVTQAGRFNYQASFKLILAS